MPIKYILIFLLVFNVNCHIKIDQRQNKSNKEPILYDLILIPDQLLIERQGLIFGGDIRIGDLQNNGQVGFIVYRSATSVNGGATQPCFIGAFTSEGKFLWKKGSGGFQPNRPGPVAIHDIDADGENEVICLFAEDTSKVSPFSMENVSVQILNGRDGTIKKSSSPFGISKATGKGPNWVHHRILIANLNGNPTPQDFIIKLGTTIYAFDYELNLLWTYYNSNDQYQNCPSYVPAIGDMNNDGLDEINGGYYLLDHNGTVIWERKLGRNMDCVLIDHWDSDSIKRAICSGFGFIMDHQGDTILMLGEEIVPHGQELRVANFDSDEKGREMMVRYNGHHPDIRVINQSGEVIRQFTINNSPNNTGMEAVYWDGKANPALLYNGGALWTGKGDLLYQFDDLINPPVGNEHQGWYHCIPVDMAGDHGEEVILYNPWENKVFIFASKRKGWNKQKIYTPTSKQYNVRLMD